MSQQLFHVSEDAGITRFEPRPIPSPDSGLDGLAVWAVAESHLPNYLVPRECPRICFRAGPQTSADDRDRFLGSAERVVAFEEVWLERARQARLALYHMPVETFEAALPEAGYWISRQVVEPAGLTMIDDALSALTAANTEVRILDSFWPLRDAVIASTLQFSIIRTRNARSRSG